MNAYEETRQAAQEGIRRSSEGARAWRPFMTLCVRTAAVEYAYVTMDEVRAVAARHISLDPPPFNLMGFGAVMQRAQRDGVLRKMEGTERPSKTRSQHRARAVYQSLVFAPGSVVTPGGIQPLLLEYDEMLKVCPEPIRLVQSR